MTQVVRTSTRFHTWMDMFPFPWYESTRLTHSGDIIIHSAGHTELKPLSPKGGDNVSYPLVICLYRYRFLSPAFVKNSSLQHIQTVLFLTVRWELLCICCCLNRTGKQMGQKAQCPQWKQTSDKNIVEILNCST